MTISNLKKNTFREIDKGIRKLMAPKGVRELPKKWPDDFSDFTKKLWNSVGPYTMTSKERVASLEAATRYICQNNIEGAFVECGVAGGGSVMTMMFTMLDMGIKNRDVWLYDTFEGMPEPSEHDIGRFGSLAKKTYKKRLTSDGVSTWINIPMNIVKENLSTIDYPSDHVYFVKGRVEETLQTQKPDRIALLRLDTDWYESTKAEMKCLFPRVENTGVIIIDDYYRWQGSRKAVDDYLEINKIKIFWSRVDEHSVIGIKQNY